MKPFNKTAKRLINKNWRVYEDLSVVKEPEKQEPELLNNISGELSLCPPREFYTIQELIEETNLEKKIF